MVKRVRGCGCIWLIVGFTLSANASAQVLYGSIVGTLIDETGAVVPKATVTVTHTATGLSRQATTDAEGYYSIPNLHEGTYDLSVSAEGFKPYTQTGVSVSINGVTRVDATIQVGALDRAGHRGGDARDPPDDEGGCQHQPGYAGDAEPAALRTTATISRSSISCPAPRPARFQNAVTDTPGRALSTNVNGQERGANNTRVDGSADILVTMPHHAVYVPPIESIQEVNIATNNFDAEQGMTGGAAVTVITKSGTNEFRGSAFAMHDNSALRAFTWDENRAGVTEKPERQPQHRRRQPRRPDPAEQVVLLHRTGKAPSNAWTARAASSVPTADFRGGDFSRMLGAPILSAGGGAIMVPTTEGGSTALREGMIFDPFSGNLDGTGRSVFSSGGQLNVIPQARLNGPMMKTAGPGAAAQSAGDTNNYFNSGTQRAESQQRRRQDQLEPQRAPSALVQVQHDGRARARRLRPRRRRRRLPVRRRHRRRRHARADRGHRPDLHRRRRLPDRRHVRLDALRPGRRYRPISAPNFGSDVLGIPGTNGPDPRESGMPPFYIAGFSALGNPEGWNPLYRNDQSYTLNTNASWTKGTHDIRFGFDFVHHLMNHWQPELGEGPRGAFYFDPGVTALNPEALDALGRLPRRHAVVRERLERPRGVPARHAGRASGKSSQFIKMNSFENQYALYIRDRWRATPKLTLDLGLRWELYPESHALRRPRYRVVRSDHERSADRRRGGIPQDNGVGFSKKLFAPRVGFAYQITRDTAVIRSGYGITYHSHPWGAQALRGWYPLTVVAAFSGVNGFQPVTTGRRLRRGWRSQRAARARRRHPLDLLSRHQHAAACRCQAWPRRAIRVPTRSCTAATSSRGT